MFLPPANAAWNVTARRIRRTEPDTVTEDRQVTEEVRKERIDTETDRDTRH